MEEGVIPLNTVVATSSDGFMDLDYMDELLLEGCWLEATGSELLHFDSSTPFSPFEPSFLWPSIEDNNGGFVGIPTKGSHEERRWLTFPENLSISPCQVPQYYRKSPPRSSESATELESCLPQGSELSKRWWIGPIASSSVMDRLMQALCYMKDCSRDKGVLIQVWVPVNKEGKCVLTTDKQPFLIDLNCPRLANYREISENYLFPAEEDSIEGVGLPGRVFKSKVPEWTPDVRFFTRDEYPRVGDAQKVDVRGTLAVPILEQGSHKCLGVIEVVLTAQKTQYRPELETVYKALEAVDLRSAEVFSIRNIKAQDLSYQAVLPEILEVLSLACETHGLPLAQTWVSCILQGKGGCRHSEENLKDCISPVDSACYIGDSRVQGFHEACSDYHLLRGEGIVGTAVGTNEPCFSPDVTDCSRKEYPLSHYARVFGLKAAVAIRLRSICTGLADYILELFLPTNCIDLEEQKKMLTSLSTIIRNVCRTLRVVTNKELREEPPKVINSSMTEVTTLDRSHSIRPYCSSQTNRQESGSAVSPLQNGKSRETFPDFSEVRLAQRDSNTREDMMIFTTASMSADSCSQNTNRASDKRRIKVEKTITLQVLRQHFAGSLKDAARNLGVCPTTLKRICRQHGIPRWPSRKIKKVGYSLQKIQRVIDSVQGASGVLQIDTFYSSFPELASPNASGKILLSDSKSTDNPKPLDTQEVENSILRPPAPASMSLSCSGSQSSSSSQCYSSDAPPYSYLTVAGQEDSVIKEISDSGMLKRTRTDAHLHLSGHKRKVLPKSQSHVSLHWLDKREDDITGAAEVIHQQSLERDGPRIKVTCGEDNIRFRMHKKWRYNDLVGEIFRRFGVGNPDSFHLKYLDDDAEWVLLTCDADLEECVDIWRSSKCNTIKLSFLPSSNVQSSRRFEGSSSL